MAEDLPAPDSVTELKSLLEQVQILANQIKKSAFVLEDNQQPLAVGRAVLATLEASGPQTVPSIAERRSSSRQNVQIVVNRLRRLGWVEFTTNPLHRKSGLVQITPEGAAVLKSGVGEESKFLEALSERISEADLQPTIRLLASLQEAFAQRDAPNGHPVRKPHPPRTPPQSTRLEQTPAAAAEETTPLEDNSLPYNLL